MKNAIRLSIFHAAGHRVGTEPLVEATMTAAVNSSILQSFCQQILLQPDLDLGGFGEEQRAKLPDVNASLATARASARMFLDETNPNMWSAVTDISAYGNLVAATLDEIEAEGLLDRFLADPEAQGAFVALMSALRDNSMTRQAQAIAVRKTLEAQRDLFAEDAAALGSDGSIFNAVLEGSEAALVDLMGDLETLQDEIDDAITGVVLTALTTALGIGLIAVGTLTTVFSGGTSTAITVLGVGLTVGGTIGVGFTSSALRNANVVRRDLLVDQAQLEGEIVLLTDLSMVVTGLANCAANAAATVQQMADGWTDIANNIGQIADLAQSATTEDEVALLRVYTNAIGRQWGDLREVALRLQTDFQSLDTRTVDSVIDDVPVMDVEAA